MGGVKEFQQWIKTVTNEIGSRPLDASLQTRLQQVFPYEGMTCETISATCKGGRALVLYLLPQGQIQFTD